MQKENSDESIFFKVEILPSTKTFLGVPRKSLETS
jgi:hypothetical protein